MDIGTLLLMAGVSYAFGIFWYSLLPGSIPDHTWRVAAFPFFFIFLGETFASYGPAFGGLHPITVVIASLVGILVDWAIREARHPYLSHEPDVEEPLHPRTRRMPPTPSGA